MTIIIFRLLYGIYAAVMLYIIVHSISDFAFNKKATFKILAKRLAISPFWILAAFSPAGRKFLFKSYIERM